MGLHGRIGRMGQFGRMGWLGRMGRLGRVSRMGRLDRMVIMVIKFLGYSSLPPSLPRRHGKNLKSLARNSHIPPLPCVPLIKR